MPTVLCREDGAAQLAPDGRTHLPHKAEHALDLETGAIGALTLQEADQGDTTTIQTTLPEAIEQLKAVAAVIDDRAKTGDELRHRQGLSQ